MLQKIHYILISQAVGSHCNAILNFNAFSFGLQQGAPSEMRFNWSHDP